MRERWVEVDAGAKDRQEQQFSLWSSAKGLSFSNSEAEAAYAERIGLIKDAVQLVRRPRRIPICPSPGAFPISHAGSTPYEGMYDYDRLETIWQRYYKEFDPDVYVGPGNAVSPGKVFDLLDFTLYKWPGHGLSKDQSFQFVEKEYMKAEEYPELIDDPSGYFLRAFFPRIFGTLKPFEAMPLFPMIHEMPIVAPGFAPFGTPEFQKALSGLMEAASEASRWMGRLRALSLSIMGKGYPALYGGFSKAPFDVIGDSLRGTAGVMMDMYRKPDELLEACERLTPFMVKAGVAGGRLSGHPLIFMPLHKGADGFMSDKQFRRFYWPTLKKVIIGLINEGLVPLLFAEGGYNSRLDVISELPKGLTVWWFDLTDMVRAKETVGKVACIAGNVPLALLCAGTVDEVKAYCKDLIDRVGRDGGFIFSSGAGMDGARSENVKAMIDFSRDYGVGTG